MGVALVTLVAVQPEELAVLALAFATLALNVAIGVVKSSTSPLVLSAARYTAESVVWVEIGPANWGVNVALERFWAAQELAEAPELVKRSSAPPVEMLATARPGVFSATGSLAAAPVPVTFETLTA